MRTFTTAFQQANSQFPPLLKKEAGPLLGILLGCELSDQLLLWMEKSTVTLESQNLTFVMLRVLIGMLLGFLISVLVYRSLAQTRLGRKRKDFFSELTRYVGPLAIEGLRALGWILLWSLLFLIPGIYKYIRYAFVSAVVLVDPEYMEGKVDALVESERLTMGIWWPLFAITAASGVLVVLIEFQKEKFPLFAAPLLWFFSFSLLSALTIYLNVLLYQIYSVKKNG